ncbi:MAG: glycosyltransferase, partial [Betaproteobacteria bacterium]|nr:glycosyltransferase [Betaproteobacteria bacterium]
AGLRRSYGLGEDDYVIGMAAVLRPEKNPLQLVEAVGALRHQGIPAKALFIGDGEMRPQIEARARALAISDHVVITGLRQEVRPELAACDVLTLCSVTEALSLAALEAMAMGLPVVHSDVGGARELIAPGHNGFVFARGDLAGFVRHLAFLSDRRLSRLLGSHARRVAEDRFSLTGMVDHYEQLLLEICNSGAALGRSQAPAAPGGYGYVVMKQDYTRSEDQ